MRERIQGYWQLWVVLGVFIAVALTGVREVRAEVPDPVVPGDGAGAALETMPSERVLHRQLLARAPAGWCTGRYALFASKWSQLDMYLMPLDPRTGRRNQAAPVWQDALLARYHCPRQSGKAPRFWPVWVQCTWQQDPDRQESVWFDGLRCDGQISSNYRRVFGIRIPVIRVPNPHGNLQEYRSYDIPRDQERMFRYKDDPTWSWGTQIVRDNLLDNGWIRWDVYPGLADRDSFERPIRANGVFKGNRIGIWHD